MIDIYEMTDEERRKSLIEIERAIFSNVDYASFNGNQVKFRSLADMERIRDILRNMLGKNKAARRARRPRRAVIRTY